jgi:transglutaminase-like putative cysteine protease
MRAWILMLAVALLPAVLASQEAEELFASSTVGVDVTVSSDLRLFPKRDGVMNADYVQADLFFYPKQDIAQKVTAITAEPQAELKDNALRYRWEKPGTRLRYEAASSVEVQNVFPRVMKKIAFPLKNIPAEARRYLEPSEHIDSTNPAIVNQANKLAQGKDDLWLVVSEFAIWTKNNVAYNLSTLTAEVAQKASWVLQNRNGVCDELTSLFIAMLRAVGVPARFVTGVSYTASPLFPEKWGAHGWAEVYFPDVGWVPFDPTFGEFGWIDPGHVKMMTSLDSGDPSVRFEWRGNNVNLEFSEPDVDASVTSVGERLPPTVALAVSPLYDEVGFGSHNLVQATVENLQPYYVTTEVRLARVNELDVLEAHDRQVILKPREKKTVFWRVKIAEGLQERFVYTIPLGVYTVRNDSAKTSFTARAQGGMHGKAEVTRAMNTLAEEEEAVVEKTLDLSCTADKDMLYPEDAALVRCLLRNIGTAPLKSVNTCIEDKNCKAVDIGIGQTRTLEFTQEFTSPGATTLFVRASNPEVTRSVPIPFVMQDNPAVNITKLFAPKSVKHGEAFSAVFTLDPVSHNTPKNVHVTVSTNVAKRTFEMPELPGEQVFEVELDADDLSLGITDVHVTVRYDDERGKSYMRDVTTAIELTDVPFLSKIWLWFRGWVE